MEATAMSPKKPYTLKIDPELLEALREIKERDGIPESEQIRRGIRLWLDSKGHTQARRSGRKRAVTRKRS
jgi:Ribbon-helix-helix domain